MHATAKPFTMKLHYSLQAFGLLFMARLYYSCLARHYASDLAAVQSSLFLAHDTKNQPEHRLRLSSTELLEGRCGVEPTRTSGR